jgi:hypothetical protein
MHARGHIPALNRRRKAEDNFVLVSPITTEPNVHKEVWSPLDFDKKYLELAQLFLDREDTDKAANVACPHSASKINECPPSLRPFF